MAGFTGLSTLLRTAVREFLFELELLVLAVLGIAGMALFLLYVHCARSSGKPSPPAHVDRVVRCSFYRTAGSPCLW